MKCWGLWYGGDGCVCANFAETEEFDSIEHAMNVFISKSRKLSARMDIWFVEPSTLDDLPDKIITFGPVIKEESNE